MIMMIVIFLLLGLIEHVSSIQCYTCNESGFHCSLPLNFDGGDESNENNIEILSYDPEYACLSDQSFNPRTGKEKKILSGIEHCKEINIPNRRVYCCYTDNCNKELPLMIVRTLADEMIEKSKIESSSQRYISSIILIIFSIIFYYFY